MQSDHLTFSIVTVVRNAAPTISETINSVARQNYDSFEYIIVDGASDDGTLGEIERHRHRVGRLISEPDHGIYHAMNKALELARGKWLIFVGADDLFVDPSVLSDISKNLKDERAVYYGNVLLKSSGKTYCGEMNTYRLMQQNICHQAIFYPREQYTKRKYDLAFGLLADYAYNIELWGARVPFIYIDRVVCLYNDLGASSLGDQIFERQKLSIIKKHLGWLWFAVKYARNLAARILKA